MLTTAEPLRIETDAQHAAALAEVNDLLRWMGCVHIVPDAEALPTDEPFAYPALLERVDRLRALVVALQGVA